MRIETALKLRDSALTSLRDVYANARHSRPTHAAMLSDISAISATLNRAPQWTRTYFDGYNQAMADALIRGDSIVFGGYLDGQFYTTDSTRSDYYGHYMQSNVWCEETRSNGRVTDLGHHWTPSLSDGRVSPSPYFV